MCCRKVSPPATKAELATFHCLLDDQLWATAPQILPLVLSLEVVPFQEGQVTKGTRKLRGRGPISNCRVAVGSSWNTRQVGLRSNAAADIPFAPYCRRRRIGCEPAGALAISSSFLGSDGVGSRDGAAMGCRRRSGVGAKSGAERVCRTAIESAARSRRRCDRLRRGACRRHGRNHRCSRGGEGSLV